MNLLARFRSNPDVDDRFDQQAVPRAARAVRRLVESLTAADAERALDICREIRAYHARWAHVPRPFEYGSYGLIAFESHEVTALLLVGRLDEAVRRFGELRGLKVQEGPEGAIISPGHYGRDLSGSFVSLASELISRGRWREGLALVEDNRAGVARHRLEPAADYALSVARLAFGLVETMLGKGEVEQATALFERYQPIIREHERQLWWVGLGLRLEFARGSEQSIRSILSGVDAEIVERAREDAGALTAVRPRFESRYHRMIARRLERWITEGDRGAVETLAAHHRRLGGEPPDRDGI